MTQYNYCRKCLRKLKKRDDGLVHRAWLGLSQINATESWRPVGCLDECPKKGLAGRIGNFKFVLPKLHKK